MTTITGFMKDGSKRVIKVKGNWNYDMSKALIADLEGASNILKIEMSK